MRRLIILLTLTLAPLTSHALEAFACEPEWGALITELAGDQVNVTVATTAFQDPHHIQAKPSLLAAMRRADLLVCSGADLEIGWLPLLLRRAGSHNIQPGSNGYFLAADYVRKLEVPTRLDRSEGDIHPQGNPHIQLNPHNIARVARKLSNRLATLDPANTAWYEARLADFQGRWADAVAGWETRAKPLASMRLVSHHLGFSYLADWLDLDIVATLEAKPGIPPSSKHLTALLEQLTPRPPVAIIRTPYSNEKPSLWLAHRLDVPAIVLPFTVDHSDHPADLFELFTAIIKALEEVRQ